MKFWAYLHKKVHDCDEPADLVKLDGFSETTSVCPSGGEIERKNWRPAAEFPELLEALETWRKTPALPDPEEPLEKPLPQEASELIPDPQKLFLDRMEAVTLELRARREERELVRVLEGQVRSLRGELARARERLADLEDKASLLPGYEDRERLLRQRLEETRAEVTRLRLGPERPSE